MLVQLRIRPTSTRSFRRASQTRRRGTSPASRARPCASSTRTSTPATGRIDIPRPTWAMWIGDNWRVSNDLTVNYGVRWDVDWGVASPPDVITNSIPINNGAPAGNIDGMVGTDFGYKDDIRDNNNIAPRVGFTYNVGGKNDLVIRGGTGLYFTTPVSNMTFSPQIYSQMVTAAFLPPASGNCANGSRSSPIPHAASRRSTRRRPRRRRSRRASSAPTTRTRTRGRAASASRSRSTP